MSNHQYPNIYDFCSKRAVSGVEYSLIYTGILDISFEKGSCISENKITR
jgi:hypothetical protein